MSDFSAGNRVSIAGWEGRGTIVYTIRNNNQLTEAYVVMDNFDCSRNHTEWLHAKPEEMSKLDEPDRMKVADRWRKYTSPKAVDWASRSGEER